MDERDEMQQLMSQAQSGNFEAPAEVRGFAKRARNLWGALLAEGMQPMEISQLLCVPMVIHLNGPDLPET